MKLLRSCKIRTFANGTVLVASLLICLQNVESKPSNEQCSNVCYSSDCRNEAEFLLKTINSNADPCDNFFEFACGNFVKNTEIPDDASSISLLTIMEKELETKIIDLLQKKISLSDSKTVKNLKIHYNNCLDKATTEAMGTKPILDILNYLGGWPVLQTNWRQYGYSWEKTVSKISSLGLENKFPIMLSVGDDSTDSSKKNLKIHVAELTVTDSFFSDDGTLLKSFESFMVDLAVMLGADRNVAQKEMKECLDFEIKLHKIKTSLADLQKVDATSYRFSIQRLSQMYRGIPWLNIINSMLNPSNVNVNMYNIVELQDPKYIFQLDRLLKNTSKRTLANYQLWQVIADLIDYLPQAFDDRKLIFEKIASGIDKRPNRSTWCVKKVRETLPVAVSSVYVKYFDKQVKNKVYELILDIKSQTKTTINNLSWMDDRTRKAALEKLEAMDAIIAYPDELLDNKKVDEYYKELEIQPGSFIGDYLKINQFLLNDHYRQLKKSTGQIDWATEASVAVVNAYYAFSKNKIILPAGILRGHIFQSNLPKYVSYGSMGYVIGHEIIHGFDTIGSNYDKEGNLANWWDGRTKNKFDDMAKCIIEQYSNYTIDQIGEKVKGENSITENIADNGGIKSAYHAYQKWANSNRMREPCLPNLNYTPQQMFWISAANVWCAKIKDDTLRRQVQEDVHVPNVARVSVTFSNVEEFARDFKCKVGSKMNPVNRCSVW